MTSTDLYRPEGYGTDISVFHGLPDTDDTSYGVIMAKERGIMLTAIMALSSSPNEGEYLVLVSKDIDEITEIPVVNIATDATTKYALARLEKRYSVSEILSDHTDLLPLISCDSPITFVNNPQFLKTNRRAFMPLVGISEATSTEGQTPKGLELVTATASEIVESIDNNSDDDFTEFYATVVRRLFEDVIPNIDHYL